MIHVQTELSDVKDDIPSPIQPTDDVIQQEGVTCGWWGEYS